MDSVFKQTYVDKKIKFEISWLDDCINGVAAGSGELQTTAYYGQGVDTQKSLGTESRQMHRGSPFGFGKRKNTFIN